MVLTVLMVQVFRASIQCQVLGTNHWEVLAWMGWTGSHHQMVLRESHLRKESMGNRQSVDPHQVVVVDLRSGREQRDDHWGSRLQMASVPHLVLPYYQLMVSENLVQHQVFD